MINDLFEQLRASAQLHYSPRLTTYVTKIIPRDRRDAILGEIGRTQLYPVQVLIPSPFHHPAGCRAPLHFSLS